MGVRSKGHGEKERGGAAGGLRGLGSRSASSTAVEAGGWCAGAVAAGRTTRVACASGRPQSRDDGMFVMCVVVLCVMCVVV